MKNKVMVSGCFDVFHAGHLAFLESAAKYGELYVSIGSDRTVRGLKNRPTIYNQDERLAIISGLRCVKEAVISEGEGALDFVPELDRINPGIFVVNYDGDSEEKREICERRGIKYIVLEREPFAGLPVRSTTELRKNLGMPYRIDLAGGWLDQPFVSEHHPGAVLTISIEPTHEFNLRSGMATSTRKRAVELWGSRIPAGNLEEYERAAKVLFGYDNLPGTKEIAGSQDAIGIVFPGMNRLFYRGKYWPEKIDSFQDPSKLKFIENHLALVPLQPRNSEYQVLGETNINPDGARALANAADLCLEGIMEENPLKFGRAVTEGFDAQSGMFPRMRSGEVVNAIRENSHDAYGWKVSGAGGGGYLVLICDEPQKRGLSVNIRREMLNRSESAI